MLRVCISFDERMDPDMWAATLAGFPVDEVYICGKVPTNLSRYKPFKNATLVPDAKLLSGDLVVFSPVRAERMPSTTFLGEMLHPEDALYFFGADNRHLERSMIGREPLQVVGIECMGFDHLYAHVAAAIVLHDRLVKLG